MKRSNISSILYMILLGGIIAITAGLDPSWTIVTCIAIAAFMNIPSAVLGANVSSIDLSALNTVLGAYCREFADDLISDLLIDDSLADDFNVYDDIQDELALPNLSATGLVQPGNDLVFNPKANALKFGARILKVRPCKVDLQIVPSLLEKSWLGHKKSSTDPWDIPFEQFIWDYIIGKAKEDIRLNGLFKGVYNPAGENPGDCLDGWLKVAADAITAGLPPVLTGPIDSDNVVDSLLAVYDGLGEKYKNKPSMMKAAPQIFDWYSRKFTPVVNPVLVATDVAARLATPQIMDKMLLAGTNAILYREPGLGTSQRVIVTPQENWAYGCNTIDNFSFKTEQFERTIKVMIDFKVGVNFAQTFAGAISVNDQA